MRAPGTRTLTMAFLLLTLPAFFVVAELSWLVGRRAQATPALSPERELSTAGASIAGGIVCPLIAVVLGIRLARRGHRVLGGAIAVVAPLLMVLAARGLFS